MINIYKLLTEYNTKLKIKTINKTLKFLKTSIYMYIVQRLKYLFFYIQYKFFLFKLFRNN